MSKKILVVVRLDPVVRPDYARSFYYFRSIRNGRAIYRPLTQLCFTAVTDLRADSEHLIKIAALCLDA